MQLKSVILTCTCFALFAAAGKVQAAALHTVSIQSDGRDELRISNGSLSIEHLSWALPSGLVVDGASQTLAWNGNTSSPVSVAIAGDYWVKKSLGRDGAYAVQRSDGFALAVSDNPNGGDLYQFQLFASPEANTTDWMHVFGAGATPGLMSFPGTAGYTSQPPGAETTFSLTVDGTDELMFVNGSLVIRHLSWVNPTALTINGVSQTLTFNGNLSDPIPLTLPDGFQFTQLGGRTTLYPVQTPVGLLIGADDELLGPDTYTWKLTAVPEPTGALTIATIVMLAAVRRAKAQSIVH